jgi:DnaJ domain
VIRTAYRARAREHHPDRNARESAAEMMVINEAYRVLADPTRRAAYDRSLREPVRSAAAPAPGRPTATATYVPPVDVTPARFPWKLMGVMAAFGVGFVLMGAILFEPVAEPAPDGVLQSGSCVTVLDNNVVSEVRCDDGATLVVDRLVPVDTDCPAGTAQYPDRLGMGQACVVERPTPEEG